MKFLCISDLHITKEKPRNRTEINYWEEAVKPKLDFIFNYFKEHECDFILCGGDLLDKPVVSNAIISYLVPYWGDILTTLGQHCLMNRNLNDECSISLLNQIEVVDILSSRSKKSFVNIDDVIYVYGCGYEEEIPEIKYPGAFNILLLHQLVSKTDEWNKKVSYTGTKQLFKKTKFDIIVTGDNHSSFADNQKDRWILNSGSMMRKNIDQLNHKPCFFILNTDTVQVEQVFIPCRSSEEAFKIEKYTEEKEISLDLKAFEEELSRKDYKPEFNFLNDLYTRIDDVDEDVKNITEEAIQNANSTKR